MLRDMQMALVRKRRRGICLPQLWRKNGFGGMSLSLGMVPDEEFEDKYKQLIANLDVNEVLKLICLDEIFSESDCRIITPEEYDRLYEEG